MLVVAALVALPAAAKERAEIAVRYTWNLADLYPNEAAWTAAKEALAKRVPEFARFQGHLGDSPAALHDALAAMMDMARELERLQAYATQLADQDRRVSRSLELQQEGDQLAVQVQTAASFVAPELLAMGADRVRRALAAEPKLAPYAMYLEDVLRRAPHTLTTAEEKVAAQAGNLTDAGHSVHSVFTNAELPYAEIRLASGEQVRLDAAAYTRYRAVPDRAERDKVFQTFWGTYQNYRRTLAASLYAQVKGHVFDKDVHKFESSLAASLFRFNVPTTVYRQLLQDVHANLPALHRYLKLRQRMMSVDQLRYEDLYASIIQKVDLEFSPEQAMDLTLAACAPLGADYVRTLQAGFDARWVDWFPSTGKRSGAYSNAAYGVHPYQLQNFMGRYEDVSTLAHECGHSMHSYLSDKTQPYPTHSYPIFVAEVASTLNENLLFHHMLDTTKDDATRLFLLGGYLDNMRQTLFRQTLFAEFELAIHEMAERGESLTGDNLNALYLKLVREYYGHDQGVCKVDSLYGVEWAYIPHFYYNFYVYQYATSMIAAISLANHIRDEAAAEPRSGAARDAYLKLLAAGGSKYPIDLLKEAGVDMTTSEPFKTSIREMNKIVDEIEAILARRAKG
jgi:oligoendopeptidase F